MEQLPKLTRNAARMLQERLRIYWEILKTRFSQQAEEDLKRAEERHRGKNDY
jgi:hypothetical protein